MRKITHIVLHCTATPQHTTVASIQNYWRKILGWRSPGYHRIIKPDGNVVMLASDDKIVNGVAGHNANSIHLSYIGGVDGANKPVDNRTTKQKESMIQLITELKVKYPGVIICGHRDFPGVAKACPSFDVAAWLKEVGL
jgi:N-acetylmuramoyl-L-alanine amidase